MKLLIVESPAKAKTIGKYLGKGYNVVSSYGHVRGIPSKSGAVDPEREFLVKYTLLDKAEKHLESIVKNVRKSKEVYLATDPDREGEAIAWHIVELLRERELLTSNLTIRRVIFNEVTEKAIKAAVSNPKDLDINLVQAQQTRQALDYLVGFTISPLLWRKLPGSRSAGRVQSVALRLICEREKEIESFKQEEYWTIEGLFQKTKCEFKAELYALGGNKLDKLFIKNAQMAGEIASQLMRQKFAVSKLTKKTIAKKPHPPFTTSTLIQEASKKLGFTAKKTASIAQKLYEGISIGESTTGLITYMRTDSVYVSSDAAEATNKFIVSTFGRDYAPAHIRSYKNKVKNAQEAHEAIRPTDVALVPSDISKYLTGEQLKLYELVWKRMVASQMSDASIANYAMELKQVSNGDLSVMHNNALFRATTSEILFEGFYKLYTPEEDSEKKNKVLQSRQIFLFDAKVGEEVNLKDIIPLQHFTQPPGRYGEASLVKSLEELGIGRPSTYPTIISILQDRKYAIMENKKFAISLLGRAVSAFLNGYFTEYVQYDFTAHLEDQLDAISNGDIGYLKVLSNFWYPFKEQAEKVEKVKAAEVLHSVEQSLPAHIFAQGEQCPLCNVGNLVLKNSKYGLFVGCSEYPKCCHLQPLNKGSTSNNAQNDEREDLRSTINNTRSLGYADDEKLEIFLNRGVYGSYVTACSMIEGDTNVMKKSPVPQSISIESLNLALALKLLKLPYDVGVDSITQNKVTVEIGKFGPYVKCGEVKASIKEEDFDAITLERAEELLQKKRATPGKKFYKRKTTAGRSSLK